MRVVIKAVAIIAICLGAFVGADAKLPWTAAEVIGVTGSVHVDGQVVAQFGPPQGRDLSDHVRLWRVDEPRQCHAAAIRPYQEPLRIANGAAGSGFIDSLSHDFGLATNDAKARFIVNSKCYTSPDPSTWREISATMRSPLELTPGRDRTQFKLQLHAGAEPVAEAEVTGAGPGSHLILGCTDSSGEMLCVLRESGQDATQTTLGAPRGVVTARHLMTLLLPVEVIPEHRS